MQDDINPLVPKYFSAFLSIKELDRQDLIIPRRCVKIPQAEGDAWLSHDPCDTKPRSTAVYVHSPIYMNIPTSPGDKYIPKHL